MMALAYASFAVVLLAYVSTQVYTSSLMEDVAHREEQRRTIEENIGVMMSEYAGLVARARVARYCEQKLGMVEADATRMIRVRVPRGGDVPSRSEESTSDATRLPELLGANLVGVTEVIRR